MIQRFSDRSVCYDHDHCTCSERFPAYPIERRTGSEIKRTMYTADLNDVISQTPARTSCRSTPLLLLNGVLYGHYGTTHGVGVLDKHSLVHRVMPRDITERPHAPSGVAVFMSAHSKTPYFTPSLWERGSTGAQGGSSCNLPCGTTSRDGNRARAHGTRGTR